MQKWYPKSDEHGLQKGPKKKAQITKLGSKIHPRIGFQKNIEQLSMFSTLECGSCIVNNTKLDEIQVLVLAPFWV